MRPATGRDPKAGIRASRRALARRLPPQPALMIVIVAVGALAQLRAPAFLSGDNLLELLRDTSTYFIASCPVALLIIAGGLDFSVGATFSVGAIVACLLMVHGIAWPLAILAGLAGGGAIGWCSGFAVVRLNIPPFIATLAAFFIATGLVDTLVSGLVTPLPAGFLGLAQDSLFDVPLLVWYAVGAGIVTWVALEKTPFGYNLRAIGGNRDAALATGIPVRRTEMTLYTLCAAAAGFAGILYASRTSAGQPDAGGYLLTLEVLTMVLVGGVSLSGGNGSVGGVALGALLIGELSNALGVASLNPSLSDVFVGGILAVAVALDGIRRRRRFSEDPPLPAGASPPVTSVSRLEIGRLIETHGRVEAERILSAVSSERKRIERDLHDGTQQQLVMATMLVRQAAAALSGADSTRATELLDTSIERLRDALADVRSLSRGIYPAQISNLGLRAAVETLVGASVLPIALHADQIPRLPEDVEVTAYFVVSEGLANVLKHAEAQEVTVTLTSDGTTLRVSVSDDGNGGVDESAGSGLKGLRTRVEGVGGELEILTPPGGGSLLAASFPCQHACRAPTAGGQYERDGEQPDLDRDVHGSGRVDRAR